MNNEERTQRAIKDLYVAYTKTQDLIKLYFPDNEAFEKFSKEHGVDMFFSLLTIRDKTGKVLVSLDKIGKEKK